MSTRRSSRRALWAAALLGVAAIAYRLLPDTRPSVVLITVDSLRPNHLSAYGHAANVTPNTEWLAREGTVFENAFCDVPWTTSSMASTLTARYAPRHRLRRLYERLPEDEITVTELLSRAGYRTAAVVGSFYVDHIFNLSQGFDDYDDRYNAAIVDRGVMRPRMRSRFFDSVRKNRSFQVRKLEADSYRTDETVADAAVGWIRRASRMRPFFLWIHFFGPHPIRKPDEDLAERMLDARFRYDLSVEGVDRQIGRILDELERHGFFRRGIVILHGDHGESLGEHGYLGHGANVYDPSLRVPLIVTAPGLLPRGARSRTLARNIDIAPTVLDLAGIALPEDADGHSLVAAMNNRDDAAVEYVYCETLLPASVFHAPLVSLPGGEAVRAGVARRCLRSPLWKYVDTQSHPLIDFDQPAPVSARVETVVRGEELYDLATDPGETQNLASARPEVRRRMRERMLALIGEEVQRREAGGRRGD